MSTNEDGEFDLVSPTDELGNFNLFGAQQSMGTDIVLVGTALEADTALALTPLTGVIGTLGQAIELNTGLTILPLTTVISVLGQVSELNLALSIKPRNTPLISTDIWKRFDNTMYTDMHRSITSPPGD